MHSAVYMGPAESSEWQSKCQESGLERGRGSAKGRIATLHGGNFSCLARGLVVSGEAINPALLAAFAAVSGSVVGSLGSVVGTWITQRHQDHRERLAKKIASREVLYSDFIVESARLLVDALEHNVSDPQKLIPVYALLSRIRLSSSSRVLETAEEVLQRILATYSQPNLTAEQIQIRAGEGEDPLREFSDTCRVELEALERKL
jgi:hypothetical protein